MNFKQPTPIQAQAIPIIMSGKDVIGIAQTGTGKTAAFILPIIHRILQDPSDGRTKALVIVPTRELALQIDQAVEAYSYFTGTSSVAIYGGGDGQDFYQEKQAIVQGVDIIIATPGRLISHMNVGYVDFSQLRYLILDEADR
ncbi:MAG: DEAD/DEAH box helicase, partial [Flavobacteriales bacterium]